MLQLTSDIYGVPSSCIAKSVSVVHACTSSCVIVECTTQRLLERENVDKTTTVHKHDYSNNTFYYNIFCTSNNNK